MDLIIMVLFSGLGYWNGVLEWSTGTEYWTGVLDWGAWFRRIMLYNALQHSSPALQPSTLFQSSIPAECRHLLNYN
jgi:hypothetical protein